MPKWPVSRMPAASAVASMSGTEERRTVWLWAPTSAFRRSTQASSLASRSGKTISLGCSRCNSSANTAQPYPSVLANSPVERSTIDSPKLNPVCGSLSSARALSSGLESAAAGRQVPTTMAARKFCALSGSRSSSTTVPGVMMRTTSRLTSPLTLRASSICSAMAIL